MTDRPRPIPEEVAEVARGARHVVVVTGAGMSAESGIPTFRDALTGLWARYRPEDLATPEAFARQPGVVWDWYAWRRERVRQALPNAGHRALARLETVVPRLTLVTQNVDGLHQRAGSTVVVELHGNLLRSRCSREGLVFDRWEEVERGPPRCPKCGAYLRPDVVWFGEALPRGALQAAFAAAQRCDILFSVGTSNVVKPAASLPWEAAAQGTPVVVVNPDAAGQRRGPGIHHVPLRASELHGLLATMWPSFELEVGP